MSVLIRLDRVPEWQGGQGFAVHGVLRQVDIDRLRSLVIPSTWWNQSAHRWIQELRGAVRLQQTEVGPTHSGRRASGPVRKSCGLVEFEYLRGGTLAYLAAWDVHHAKLFDRVEQTTGIIPFGRLVDQVMTVEPYKSARTVYWVVDNGSSHAGRTSVKRMAEKYPNARLIHLPLHASWLNQIELYFSIVQRKAMTPKDFRSLAELARHLMDFAQHYRTVARAFEWTFTRAKLDAVIKKIARHQPAARLALAA